MTHTVRQSGNAHETSISRARVMKRDESRDRDYSIPFCDDPVWTSGIPPLEPVYYSPAARHVMTASEPVRELATMADAMAEAIVRLYARQETLTTTPATQTLPTFPGSYPECESCSERDAGCIGNSDVTCCYADDYSAGSR